MSLPFPSPVGSRRLLLVMLLVLPLLVGGCSGIGNWGSGSRQAPEEQAPPPPYHPVEFRDIMIPSELDFERDKSMVVKTESFAGGVLQYSGRVEVNSLADFFTTTMPRHDWKLAGSVKHKDVLLAFTKPNKTATVMIHEGEMGRRATVRIYVTEDTSAARAVGKEAGEGAPRPFSF